jgi:hypothetical protein
LKRKFRRRFDIYKNLEPFSAPDSMPIMYGDYIFLVPKGQSLDRKPLMKELTFQWRLSLPRRLLPKSEFCILRVVRKGDFEFQEEAKPSKVPTMAELSIAKLLDSVNLFADKAALIDALMLFDHLMSDWDKMRFIGLALAWKKLAFINALPGFRVKLSHDRNLNSSNFDSWMPSDWLTRNGRIVILEYLMTLAESRALDLTAGWGEFLLSLLRSLDYPGYGCTRVSRLSGWLDFESPASALPALIASRPHPKSPLARRCLDFMMQRGIPIDYEAGAGIGRFMTSLDPSHLRDLQMAAPRYYRDVAAVFYDVDNERNGARSPMFIADGHLPSRFVEGFYDGEALECLELRSEEAETGGLEILRIFTSDCTGSRTKSSFIVQITPICWISMSLNLSDKHAILRRLDKMTEHYPASKINLRHACRENLEKDSSWTIVDGEVRVNLAPGPNVICIATHAIDISLSALLDDLEAVFKDLASVNCPLLRFANRHGFILAEVQCPIAQQAAPSDQ